MRNFLVRFFKWLQFEFVSQKRLYIFLGIIALIFFFIYKDYGIAWDETDNFALGNHGLAYYTSLGKDRSLFTFYTQPGFSATHGPVIEVLRSFIMHLTGRYSMNDYHLILALFSLSAFIFLYKSTLLLTKNKNIAFLSMVLLLFTPRFFGDVFNNSKDIAPVYILLGVLYFSLKTLLLKKKRLTDFIFFGALLGAAITLRIAVVFILPLYLLIYFIYVFVDDRNFRTYIKHTSISVLSFTLVSHLVHPYLLFHPILGYFEMFSYSTKFPQLEHMLFNGRIILSTQAPWNYLPIWVLITTPLLITFTMFCGVLLPLFKHVKLKLILPYIFIDLIFFIPFFAVIVFRANIYDAWRHFLFLIGPMLLLSSLGFSYLFQSGKYISKMLNFIIVLHLLMMGYSYITLHPYEYTYFNSLIGGLKGAYQKYETDYWGKTYREAVLLFEKKIVQKTSKTIHLHTCGHPTSSIYYFSQNMKWVNSIEEAEYFICYTRYNQHKAIPDNKTVFVVERQGVPLNFVKKK